jgi:hypothetical protein
MGELDVSGISLQEMREACYASDGHTAVFDSYLETVEWLDALNMYGTRVMSVAHVQGFYVVRWSA